MWTLLRVMIVVSLLIGMAATCKVANADMKKVEEMRHFYRDHGFDFFGDLITTDEDILLDERRHAKLELLADDARTRALTQLEALLRTAKGPMEADLILRKATLLADRARTATYFQNNSVHTTRLKDPRSYLRESIAAFQLIEKRFGDHPKMDVVLFSIAYDYEDMRDKDNAYHYYDRLVSRYATSPLIGDALLAMAEINFDKQRYSLSAEQLKRIIASNHPRLKNFALYKLAWTYYNAKELELAIASLEKVVDGVNNAGGVQRARLELRKEALHDLVSFYADRPEADAPQSAPAYFDKVAKTPDAILKDYADARARRLAALHAKGAKPSDDELDEFQIRESDELLLRLTQIYRDQGKHLNTMIVAGLLIERLPKHPRTVALYRLRAESYEKLRRRDEVFNELQKFAAIVERDLPAVSDYKDALPQAKFEPIASLLSPKAAAGPSWVNAAEAVKTASTAEGAYYERELAKTAFSTFVDFANFLHGEWSKTQAATTAKDALAVYDLGVRAFLEPWRGTPLDAALELRRHRAQLQLATRKWDQAARDFNWLAAHAPAVSPVLTADVEGEIGALESWLKESPAPTPAGKESQPFNPVHARLLAAYDRYLLLHAFDEAKKDQAASTLVSAARLEREYKHDDDALARLMFYARRFPGQKDAVGATRDILALLNKANRWEELRDFSGALLKSGAYAKTEAAAEINRSNEYSSLRLLEKLESDKDWDKAADRFGEFARAHPESSFASQALIKSANAALEGSKTSKNPDNAVARLEAASLATDPATRLQALLGLEPFYRKAFQFDRLKELYTKALALKDGGPDAKTRQGLRANLDAVGELDASRFSKAGETLITADPELEKFLTAVKAFDDGTKTYRELRFARSNNNPARNFKKKADQQALLAAGAEKVASGAPKALRGAAATWAALIKSELVLELADSIDTAAAPAVLAKAAETDRTAYRQTIEAQARELRETAQKLAGEALKLAAEIDSPLTLDARLNTLLERFGDHSRVARADLRAVWSRRPHADGSSKDEIARTGARILRAESQDELRALEAELSENYARRGETGYAYAVASGITAEKGGDEPAKRAESLRFRLDLERLPASLRKAIESNSLREGDRWNFARWLAGRAATAASSAAEADLKWTDEALKALMKLQAADAAVIQAHAAND